LITHIRVAPLLFSLMAFFAGPVPAAENTTLLKDLTAVIMLLGLPCDQVISATRQAESDHIAVCRNGIRYRVFVNPEGRVVAQKQ
jgi:hypothetical protein